MGLQAGQDGADDSLRSVARSVASAVTICFASVFCFGAKLCVEETIFRAGWLEKENEVGGRARPSLG